MILIRILARFIAAAFGYLVACLAAGFAMVIGLAGSDVIGGGGGMSLAHAVYVAGVFAAFIAVLAFAPAIVAVIVSEVFALRRALYHVLAGGLTGAVGYLAFAERADLALSGGRSELALIVAAGLVAGFVYWAVSGRRAGIFAPAAAASPA